MELFDYQIDHTNRIVKAISDGFFRICCQLSTGGGKTVEFASLSNRFISPASTQRRISEGKPTDVFIVVHRIELLQQTRRTLYEWFGISAQVVVAGMRVIPQARVYIGMVESSFKRKEIIKNIGLLICDEAHITVFNKMHDCFPDATILGFTATPISGNLKKPMKDFYQTIICGIDTPELIKRGKLCQNITYAPRDVVERSTLTIRNGDFDVGLMALSFSKPRYIENTVKAYEKYRVGTKAIVFNVNIDHSLKVTQAFKNAGYNARHVDGEMSKHERDHIFKWYKSTPDAILNNVGIATTGFDEPTIENVITNHSTTSLTRWLQEAGRGGRIHPSKHTWVHIDMGSNFPKLHDWSCPRNWEEIFYNPKAASDGDGLAPEKNCPGCDAIIAAQCKTCPHCGHLFTKEEEKENPIDSFVVVTEGINVEELVSKHSEKKAYFVLFNIGTQLATMAHNTIPIMTNEGAEFILNTYYKKAKEWCNLNNKVWDDWKKEKIKEHLFDQLKTHFKNWNIPV